MSGIAGMAHQFVLPFSKLEFGVEDLTKTYERILGPLNLFAPVNGETVAAEKKFELERPVTPINSEIKKAPRALNQLTQLVRRRIQPRPNARHMTLDNQVHLANMIIAAVNNAWPSVQSLAEDPSLSPESNQELLRRIAVHIVTVCQTLYEHYLLKAEILNKRGVFSSEANMSRLKTQLAVDADKFLNVLTIRRYILADLTDKVTSGGKNVNSQARQEVKGEKLPSHLQLIHDTHVQNTVTETPQDSTQRAIEQMLREMPTLDSEKLYGVLASLPDFSFNTSSYQSQQPTPESLTDHSLPAHRKTSQEVSHDKVLLKRSNSCAELAQVENLSEELDLDIRDKKQRHSATGQRGKTQITNVDKKREQSKLSRCQEDLQKLTAVARDSTGDGEDLAPLLQAVIRNARHDNNLEKFKEELQMLEERERQRQEQERLVLPAAEHAQPSTVTQQLSEAIDSEAVKDMDRTLRLEDEIGVIYDEMLKTMTKDHLDMDTDSTYQPTVEDLNLSCALASSSLVKNRHERVVNMNLQRAAQQFESTTLNDDNQVNKIKYHSSWLGLWKETINSDDYIKYLSTKGSDYMGAIFHLYNSDNDSSADSDEETSSKVTRRVRDKSAHNDAHQKRLAELQALKSEYATGQWNVNSVLLGGLGKDPQLDTSEDKKDAVKSARKESGNPPESRSVAESRSYIVNKKQRRLEQEQAERERLAAAQPVAETPIQDQLEMLWTALQMPDSLKLDMALKYSSDEYHSLLSKAVSSWQSAAELIVKREKLIRKLESFERLASRPGRLVDKGSSTDRLPESQMRSKLNKNISSVDVVLKRVLIEIQNKYNDVITYQGRPYLDKMRCDRVEMLYWLQEERKVKALHRESRARCLPSLPVSVTAIQPVSSS